MHDLSNLQHGEVAKKLLGSAALIVITFINETTTARLPEEPPRKGFDPHHHLPTTCRLACRITQIAVSPMLNIKVPRCGPEALMIDLLFPPAPHP
jgi:hypothetical protein